jgi:hypothetical protein
LFFWEFGEYKNKKISQNVVYSKKCISLNPNRATVICAQLDEECEYQILTKESSDSKNIAAYRL